MRARGEFVVNGQSSEACEPGKRPLDHPAFDDGHKAPRTRGPAADLMLKAEAGQVPGQAPPIALIRDDRAQACAPAKRALGQQVPGLAPIVAVGRVDPAGQNTSLHVGDNLTFAAIDALASVRAPVLENARGQPHTLTVEAHERRRSRAAGGHPVGLVDRVGEPLPEARVLPAPEVVIHGRPGREASGQVTPLAARAADIAQGVQHLAQAMAALALQGQ